MATARKREGSWEITVSCGYGVNGRQIRKYFTWTPPAGMTPKQEAKELERQKVLFEERANAGTTQDGNVRFQVFAEKWLSEYAVPELKVKTIDGYKKNLVRINQAIGHIKLKDLRTGHLNSFYANLQESGMRGNSVKAMAKKRLNELLAEKNIPRADFVKLSSVSSSTISAVCSGNVISIKTAEKIAKALQVKLSDIFTVEKDMETLSSTTVRSYHRVISSILAKAVKWGYVPYNPAVNSELPKMPTHKAAYLDEEDVRKLLELLHEEPIKYRAMISVDILSGLRRGELLGLRWCDVDFTSETISVVQTSSYVTGKGVYIDTPKNHSSDRILKLSRSIFLVLQEYQEWQDKQREACGDIWHNEDNRIFTTDDGRPLHPDTLTKWFNDFVKRSGLPKVTIHSLRHTYASLMIAQGTPLVVVSSRMGHAQTSTTANIYAHIIKSADEKAALVTEMFADALTTGSKTTEAKKKSSTA